MCPTHQIHLDRNLRSTLIANARIPNDHVQVAKLRRGRLKRAAHIFLVRHIRGKVDNFSVAKLRLQIRQIVAFLTNVQDSDFL